MIENNNAIVMENNKYFSLIIYFFYTHSITIKYTRIILYYIETSVHN